MQRSRSARRNSLAACSNISKTTRTITFGGRLFVFNSSPRLPKHRLERRRCRAKLKQHSSWGTERPIYLEYFFGTGFCDSKTRTLPSTEQSLRGTEPALVSASAAFLPAHQCSSCRSALGPPRLRPSAFSGWTLRNGEENTCRSNGGACMMGRFGGAGCGGAVFNIASRASQSA